MAKTETSRNSFIIIYDKYSSILFGYISSLLKDEPQSIEVLGKTLFLLNDKINNKKQTVENELLEGIRIANRTMLQTTNLKREALLKIFKKFDQ